MDSIFEIIGSSSSAWQMLDSFFVLAGILARGIGLFRWDNPNRKQVRYWRERVFNQTGLRVY